MKIILLKLDKYFYQSSVTLNRIETYEAKKIRIRFKKKLNDYVKSLLL